MKTLAEREAEFRATLDPQLPVVEVEEMVAQWLRGQPENRNAERNALLGQLTVAVDALSKALECAMYLGEGITIAAIERAILRMANEQGCLTDVWNEDGFRAVGV